jgi:hypothetical protein
MKFWQETTQLFLYTHMALFNTFAGNEKKILKNCFLEKRQELNPV